MTATKAGFLTVEQVAGELGMTKNGVYKLIQRGKLKAIRLSERNIRVSDVALASFQRRVGRQDAGGIAVAPAREYGELLDAFIADTGMAPEQWCEAWKRDEIEDSPSNHAKTMAAIGLGAWSALTPTKRDALRALVA